MFPIQRSRRIRNNPALRNLIRETILTVDDLIYPLFVAPGNGVQQEIASLPGNFYWSVDRLADEARRVRELGINAVLLFGLPETKNESGSSAWQPDGLVQQAIRIIKQAAPELAVISDVCFCQYTTHGHCGVLKDGQADNDATLQLLQKVALSHAQAGTDLIAPSDMMDGRVKALREALDNGAFPGLPILSYAVKYASAFYGPFREAAGSAPQSGDRSAYQMDPANSDEALREVAADIEEGADLVMIKPALAYLDVIRRVRENFNIPIVAYNVSGEYAMVKAAAGKGWIDEERVVIESLRAMKRAGADAIITYHAKDVAGWLREGRKTYV